MARQAAQDLRGRLAPAAWWAHAWKLIRTPAPTDITQEETEAWHHKGRDTDRCSTRRGMSRGSSTEAAPAKLKQACVCDS